VASSPVIVRESTFEGDHRRADVPSFVGQHGHADTPSTVERSHEVRRGDPDVGEEHLVELGVARHLAQRPRFDAWAVHVEQEERDALMAGRVRVGAGHEDAPVADPSARAPHLLTVDDETISVLLGPRRQRREIASGTGLREQLAPDLLAPQGRAQVALALHGRPEP
jgi:hypothetical protein